MLAGDEDRDVSYRDGEGVLASPRRAERLCKCWNDLATVSEFLLANRHWHVQVSQRCVKAHLTLRDANCRDI